MTTNPLRIHQIGASGCDGTVLGFLASRETRFKYAAEAAITGVDTKPVLRALSLSNAPLELKKLVVDALDGLERKLERAGEELAEAQKVCDTMVVVVTKVSESIDRAITPPA